MVNSFEKTLISVIISLCRIVCLWDNIILEILVIFTFLVINVANLTTATSQLEDSARAGDGNTGQSDVEAGVLLFETVDFATGYVCVCEQCMAEIQYLGLCMCMPMCLYGGLQRCCVKTVGGGSVGAACTFTANP